MGGLKVAKKQHEVFWRITFFSFFALTGVDDHLLGMLHVLVRNHIPGGARGWKLLLGRPVSCKASRDKPKCILVVRAENIPR